MEKITTVIDLWNGYVKGLVIGEDSESMTVLAKSLKITKGLRNGKILDKEALKDTIHETIKECEKRVWEEYVDEIVIGISHPQLIIKKIQEQKRIIEWETTTEDIQHLSRIVTDSSQTANYDILKIIPVQWIVDESLVTKNPVGIKAKKLDLVADSFLIPQNFFKIINEIIDELDLYVIDIIPTILGTIESTLSFDNKDLGAITIDMGKNQTSYAVYENGQALHYNTLPLGWDTITKDISIWMQVDVNEAENTKINYWQLHSPALKNSESIDSQFLANIITARYEEILSLIQKDLKRIDKDGRLPGGVVLSGWATKIADLNLLAKDVFKVNATMAQDQNNTSPELGNNPQFMNALWLYVRSKKYSVPPTKNRWLRINTAMFSKMKQLLSKIF